ncbi:452_t:CDS:1, partial [Entrophospora sp. SA101]
MSNKEIFNSKKNKMPEIIELSDDEMNNYDEIRELEKILIKIGSANMH